MKKIFIDDLDSFNMIDVDGLHFFSNIDDGKIYTSHSLSAKAGYDICKVHIAQFTFDAKKQIMKKLFEAFVECLSQVKEVLTIHNTPTGGVIFKDGDKILNNFDPLQIRIRPSRSTLKKDYPSYASTDNKKPYPSYATTPPPHTN